MTTEYLIVDCDKMGIPIGFMCSGCHNFIGKHDIHQHANKCQVKRGPYRK